MHNTTNITSSTHKNQHHDPPRPSASSGFKIIGECDRPTSHGDAQSRQHGDAIFNVKITLSLFYNYLFHAQLIRVHAGKRCVFLSEYLCFFIIRCVKSTRTNPSCMLIFFLLMYPMSSSCFDMISDKGGRRHGHYVWM